VSRTSSGSSRLAALSNRGGASLPRSAAKEIRAPRTSTWACWNSSSGPASAFATSVSASSRAPACCFAWAAARARAARRAGSRVNTEERSRKAAAAAKPPRACARLQHARALLAQDDQEAARRFDEALGTDLAHRPFQRARLLLVYGQWLRRQRRIAEARAPLRDARDAFDAIGCAAWGAQPRALQPRDRPAALSLSPDDRNTLAPRVPEAQDHGPQRTSLGPLGTSSLAETLSLPPTLRARYGVLPGQEPFGYSEGGAREGERPQRQKWASYQAKRAAPSATSDALMARQVAGRDTRMP
jgi:hypothetical protein